jgi:hypothetical protein
MADHFVRTLEKLTRHSTTPTVGSGAKAQLHWGAMNIGSVIRKRPLRCASDQLVCGVGESTQVNRSGLGKLRSAMTASVG